MKTVITYGTFDLFHYGHLKLLEKAKKLGDRLIVGVSTDEFNELKGKKTIVQYEHRAAIVKALSFVDLVIPENTWEQKSSDIEKHQVDTFAMGSDWKGKFDSLGSQCKVVYMPRTPDVSSTEMKKLIKVLNREHIHELKQALNILESIVETFE